MSDGAKPKATGIKRLRWKCRGAVAWVAIAALLTLLFMPMVISGDLADDDTMGSICTPDGSLQIAPDRDGRSIPLPQHPHRTACPFCLAHAGYAAIPQSQVVPLPVTGEAMHRLTLPAGVIPKTHFRVGCQSRAPPLLAA